MEQLSVTKQVNRAKVLLMAMLGLGTAGIGYAWSIIQPYIISTYSIDSSAASVPFSINLGIFVIGSILGGKLQGKYLIQKTVIIGAVINGLGMFLSAIVPAGAAWLLTVTFGVFSGIGGGIVYNTMIAAAQKYFPDKIGMATGAILCTIGISGVIISPVISFLLKNFGVAFMFCIIAACTVTIGLISSIFVKNPPKGYMEDYKPAGIKIQSTQIQYEPNQMLKTKSYYIISVTMMFAVFAFMLINPQFVVLSEQKSITNAQALTAVMAAALMQAAGRLIIPSISDKTGRKIILLILFALSTGVVMGIVFSSGILYAVLFVALAFVYGGFLGTYPAVSTDYFGTKNAGINYGIVMVGFGIASVLCPILARAVRAAEMGITLSFIIAGCAAVAGFLLLTLLKKPNK